MDTQCNCKTLRGSLTILFCIFKQIGYHMLHAMKSVILQQFDTILPHVKIRGVICKMFSCYFVPTPRT